MLKIGAVNIDTSHPVGFADYMLKGSRGRYAAVYNDSFRDDEQVDAFIEKFGLDKRCSSLEELADCVDIGFIHSCNWDNHLKQAMPFVERGKPVFIDKPIVGSMADCKRLEELAASGAVILGSSSVRYCEEVMQFLAVPEQECGKIVSVFGTAGVDEFNYGVHIVEAIGGLVGAGAESCKFTGRAVIDDETCETYFVQFASGVTAVYNTSWATYQPFELVIMTTKTTYQFRVDTGKLYGSLLDRIFDYMETGCKMASMQDLTESVKIMLAGRVSRENDGKETALTDIPNDYAGYDGALFAKSYAAAARDIRRMWGA
ncbi:Gfo/Idh/MocA family oxidoreductase [bacterium]|nr:Gfo/Idh/MocA family oxidoreductase [bacterium]